MTVDVLPTASAVDDNALDALLRDVDMVCVTDVDRQTLVRPYILQHLHRGMIVRPH